MGVLAVRLPTGTDVSDEDLTEIAASVARSIRLADTATDIYRELRRRKRLTIAAELQWDLLPGRTCESGEFALAGQLEPAYTVSGDNFDWSLSEKYLTLSVSNGMASGIAAALLTQLTVNALRNARRSGAGPAEAAELANEIVYSQYGGTQHSSTPETPFRLRRKGWFPASWGKADGQTRGQAGQRTCAADLPAFIDVPGGSTSRPWCPAADQQPS